MVSWPSHHSHSWCLYHNRVYHFSTWPTFYRRCLVVFIQIHFNLNLSLTEGHIYGEIWAKS